MSLRFHEIAEGNHRILNPFSQEKLVLLGEICRLQAGMRQLDLCCGKAEMLCQWARQWNLHGVGVNISKVFLAAARARAHELDVDKRVTWVEGDAGRYVSEANGFDVVSCIGATWIGGLIGTLKLMLPDEAYASAEVGKDDFAPLIGTLDRIESAGLELVEMVLSDQDSWDRYVAAQWLTIDSWLRDHADDPNAVALRDWNTRWKRIYLQYERAYFGWGVFVLKLK